MDGLPGSERTVAPSDVDLSVRCKACEHWLTAVSTAVSPEGGHQQTFVNPDGVAFTIRLFARCDGADCQGVPQAKTSWFPGTAWVYAVCGGCRRQVGWRYSGDADFFGLIADRVIDD